MRSLESPSARGPPKKSNADRVVAMASMVPRMSAGDVELDDTRPAPGVEEDADTEVRKVVVARGTGDGSRLLVNIARGVSRGFARMRVF